MAGFLCQYAELWLYIHGYTARWLDGTKPKKADPDFVIGTTFGKPTESAIREAHKLKRRSLDKMSKGANLRLGAARLTPSGMNGQPWYYTANGSKIRAYYELNLRGVLRKMYNLTNLTVGISFYHSAVAGEHKGQPFRFVVYQGGTPTPSNGFVYVETME